MQRKSLFLLMFIACTTLLPTQGQIRDRIDKIKNSDPLTISGNVGTSLGVSYNSNNTTTATPFTGSIFANLRLNIYSFSLPFSFYFVNNTTSFSYPQAPTFRLGMTPTWKKWRFHLGYSSMHFSNYTYSGLTFLGAGFEYQGNLFRAAAFGGALAQPSRIKGYDDRSAFQQLADSLLGLNVPESTLPQYRRDAVGAKIGVGNSKNFIDISFLKAKDKQKTLPEPWRDTIKAKDNIAIGLSGRFAIKNWFTFSANLGASFYTDDLNDTLIDFGEGNSVNKLTNNIDWLFGVRNNSRVRFAGDASANFFTRVFNGSITYRFIQPEYTSLGVSSFSQNSHSLGVNSGFNMFKGRSSLNLVGYIQRDNLNNKQMYTNQVATYTMNWINTIADNFSLNLTYNGIKQDQFDGTSTVADSLRINQITHTATLSPVFSIVRANTHAISLNLNYVQNNNLNKLSINNFNVTTATAGVGYSIDIENIRLTVNGNYDFSYSISDMSQDYLTNALSAGVTYRLFSTEKTNWNLGYNASLGYNTMITDKNPESISEDMEINTISFSNSLNSNFNFNKRHSASIYFSFSNYSENIIFGQKIATDIDCRFTLSYTYTFAAKLIKKGEKKKRKTSQERSSKKTK